MPKLPWAKLPPGFKFGMVSAVATDSKYRVYVLHRGKNPVVVFDPDGEHLRSWGDNTINTPILWGATTAANVDLTVRVNDGSLTVGNLQLINGGTAASTGSFTKAGAGTLSITGTMGFTGTLFVDEGTFGLAGGSGSQTVPAATGAPTWGSTAIESPRSATSPVSRRP